MLKPKSANIILIALGKNRGRGAREGWGVLGKYFYFFYFSMKTLFSEYSFEALQ